MILRDASGSARPFVACFVLCLLMAGTVEVLADTGKRMRPLSAKDVAQVWVGLSEDELYLLRLRLDESGKGMAAYGFADQPPRRFSVESWTYRDGQIEIALESADDSPLPTPTLNGAVVGAAMKLTMSGEGWSRKVELRLEDALERRWRKLKEAMDAGE
jgi:hypothetical protein